MSEEQWIKDFEEWMEEVDEELDKACQLDHTSLVGQPFADWFESNMKPIEAAARTLDDNDCPLAEIAPHLLEYL